MCLKFPLRNLNLNLYSSHSTSIYIYEMTIAPRVCGGHTPRALTRLGCFFFFFFEDKMQYHSLIKTLRVEIQGSRAGGGDSSNQTSSSSTFLAKRASEWATVFALRFTKLTEKLLKPVARH